MHIDEETRGTHTQFRSGQSERKLQPLLALDSLRMFSVTEHYLRALRLCEPENPDWSHLHAEVLVMLAYASCQAESFATCLLYMQRALTQFDHSFLVQRSIVILWNEISETLQPGLLVGSLYLQGSPERLFECYHHSGRAAQIHWNNSLHRVLDSVGCRLYQEEAYAKLWQALDFAETAYLQCMSANEKGQWAGRILKTVRAGTFLIKVFRIHCWCESPICWVTLPSTVLFVTRLAILRSNSCPAL